MGDGNDILISMDPVIGNPAAFHFPEDLRTYLEDLGIITLAQVHNSLLDAHHYWFTAEELYLEGDWKNIWNTFIRCLDLNGIRLTNTSDSLIWEFNKISGLISADKVYECIVNSYQPNLGSRLFSTLWSNLLPRKIGCFTWLVLKNKILTWDNLQKRGKIGPGICSMCFANDETVHHIFSSCPIWRCILGAVCDQLQLCIPPVADSISVFFEEWVASYHRSSALFYIPHFAIWAVWKARNKAVFDGNKVNILCVMHQILNAAHISSSRPVTKGRKLKSVRQIGPRPLMIFPCGYFDGASTSSAAGIGFCLFLNENHHLEFELGVGQGSNTKAELLGLWAVLHSSQMMGIPLARIYGDSQVIINWAKCISALSPPELLHWCRESQKLLKSFKDLTIIHIYREYNGIADRLSKQALTYYPSSGCFFEIFDDHLVTCDSFCSFERVLGISPLH